MDTLRSRKTWPAILAGTRASWLLMLAAASGCGPLPTVEPPEPEEIETTLFLIGDAGEPDPRDVGAPLEPMAEQVAAAPVRSIVVFLGDNVYPDGIPEEGRATWADSRRRLKAQVDAVPRGARGIFVPGNHDWAGAGAFGLYSIRLQEEMIASLAGDRDVILLPRDGCPGPVAIDEGRLRLLALDTQWWLHDYIVRDAESECTGDPGTVTAELRGQVEGAGEGRVVVAVGHHPLMTGGPHGGYCGIIGPWHRFGGSSQDIISTANRTLRDSLESAFAAAPPLAYAAGHDHSLQVLRGDEYVDYILVSGAGSYAKTSCAVRLRESHFTSQNRSGFMRVDVLRERGVLLRVYEYDSRGEGGLAYSQWLEPR